MDIPPPSGDFVVQVGDAIDDGHRPLLADNSRRTSLAKLTQKCAHDWKIGPAFRN
jgi:hypothetical protein